MVGTGVAAQRDSGIVPLVKSSINIEDKNDAQSTTPSPNHSPKLPSFVPPHLRPHINTVSPSAHPPPLQGVPSASCLQQQPGRAYRGQCGGALRASSSRRVQSD